MPIIEHDKKYTRFKLFRREAASFNNPVDMVAGLGYGGPIDIIPILMESGDFDGIIFNGIGWIYSMVDPANNPQETNMVRKGAQRVIDKEVELSHVLTEKDRYC